MTATHSTLSKTNVRAVAQRRHMPVTPVIAGTTRGPVLNFIKWRIK